jgi:protein involved in polysaccharide export with SLBB domain
VRAALLRVAALAACVALAGAGAARAQQSDSLAATARATSAARMQPGDRILLKVWREPTLSDALTVDQNGMVVLPRLGPFSLAQQTVGTLQDSLRVRYAEFLRNPSIEVTILRRVGVHGEVKEPGLYWVDVTTTLRDVIALAGGLTEIANINNVVIVRGPTVLRVGNWERGGPLASDLMSGDQIVVGRTSWLSRNALAVVSGAGVLTSIIITIFRL